MRIPTLLQKISDLAEHTERPGLIELDLMLDYTRVLYADLLEWRGRLAAPTTGTPASHTGQPAAASTPESVSDRKAGGTAGPIAQKEPATVPPPAPSASTHAASAPAPATSIPAPAATSPTPAASPTPTASIPAPAASIPARQAAAPPAPAAASPAAQSPAAPAASAAGNAASASGSTPAAALNAANPAIQRPVPPVVPPASASGILPINEPTLAELAAAMDRELADEDDEEDDDITSRPVLPAAHHIPRPVVPPIPEKQAGTGSQPPAPASRPQPSGQAPKDIRSLITINDKYQIMSELFGNDKAAYEAAITAINESENEAAAIRWLQERLWVTEERSDAAVNFYDLVNRFFRS